MILHPADINPGAMAHARSLNPGAFGAPFERADRGSGTAVR